jgi:hypothetical protein
MYSITTPRKTKVTGLFKTSQVADSDCLSYCHIYTVTSPLKNPSSPSFHMLIRTQSQIMIMRSFHDDNYSPWSS